MTVRDVVLESRDDLEDVQFEGIGAGEYAGLDAHDVCQGGPPSASTSYMIWSRMVDSPTWHGLRMATMGAMSLLMGRRTRWTQSRRVGGLRGNFGSFHHGLLRLLTRGWGSVGGTYPVLPVVMGASCRCRRGTVVPDHYAGQSVALKVVARKSVLSVPFWSGLGFWTSGSPVRIPP